MIIRGGENIFPAELEAVLHEHPAVAEAAVVGVPDAVYGENVVAFVVVKPGAQVTEAEVIEHVCQHVARFKAPSRVHFLPALPKSNIGKILRRVLREQAAARRLRRDLHFPVPVFCNTSAAFVRFVKKTRLNHRGREFEDFAWKSIR